MDAIVTYFDNPVTVDNTTQQITQDHEDQH
jgi:hypothetical protein